MTNVSGKRHCFARPLSLGLTALLLVSAGLPLRAAEPQRVTQPNYKQAFKYSPAALQPFLYSTAVRPNWIGKTDSFWYEYRTSAGTQYYRVDPKEARKQPLFDRTQLATQLSELTRKAQDPLQLPLGRLSINDEGTKIKFVAEDFQYEYDLKAEKLTRLGKAPPQRFDFRGGGNRSERFRQFLEERRRLRERQQQRDGQRNARQGPPRRPREIRSLSPDRKTVVFVKDHNLYLAASGKEKEAVQLTRDGSEDYTFGLAGGGGGRGGFRRGFPGVVNWTADSKAFYALRRDARGVQELFLVNSLAAPRPVLEKYKYPMPGEEKVLKGELLVYHQATRMLLRIEPKWKDEGYSNIHWGKSSDVLRFVRRDRLHRNVELCRVNVRTGETKCLIAEGFDHGNIEFQSVAYVDGTDEMVWWSERSGWGQFYLYDRQGKLKNPITRGLFRASAIAAVDPKKRLLYFHANGREQGENVYFNHLYCVHLDGTGLTLLDPGNANHYALLSPSRQYVVDNCSAVDRAPRAVLRDARGTVVLDLERADLSRLEQAGWKMPETFTVKAADGITELYGNLWKPFDFDPGKKYPIIAHVYPGPQQEGVTHTFSPFSPEQQLAQLGFIVIQVGHRGGSPSRSKAYHRHSYFNLRDYGLADKKAAIEQLAQRHRFIDIDRVGIYGHSGGGFMSAAALLQQPYNEFFKAAVASAGNHDNNIYNHSWAERYHGMREVAVTDDKKKDAQTTAAAGGRRGPPQQKDVQKDAAQKQAGAGQAQTAKKDEKQGQKKDDKKDQGTKTQAKPATKFEIKVPTNAELAANLKGRLLLIHGEIDNNVHPANTMRLVDALIKANKRFDMLILPGKRHGFGDYTPYVTQRTWEFFAEHLLGSRPSGADIYDKKDRGR
jgi:dipeptidyl aminopeptidase/acylaminoacyl peptidase